MVLKYLPTDYLLVTRYKRKKKLLGAASVRSHLDWMTKSLVIMRVRLHTSREITEIYGH